VPQQCHRLITSMPHFTDAVICARSKSFAVICPADQVLSAQKNIL